MVILSRILVICAMIFLIISLRGYLNLTKSIIDTNSFEIDVLKKEIELIKLRK